MKCRKAPGELELIILKHLHKLEKASVSDVCDAIDNKCAYTTILTVLSRMHNKKMVVRTKIGKQYYYSVAPEHKSQSMLCRIKKSLFGGDTASMIRYLLETSDKISDKELKKIEQLLKDYKK